MDEYDDFGIFIPAVGYTNTITEYENPIIKSVRGKRYKRPIGFLVNIDTLEEYD